jgi:hypothetical protein
MKFGFVGTFDHLSSAKWGISSSATCTLSEREADILPLENIGQSYTVKRTGMSFSSGSKYYSRVVAVNQLGMATVACSDGVIIDNIPPVPGNFTIGTGGTKFIPSVRRVFGKFQHFTDNEAPMLRYEWKLIDENTGKDVTPYNTIPLTQTSPLLLGLSLTEGRKYTAILKGTNAAGLHATVKVSGIIPDETFPVCDGVPRDVTGFKEVVDRDFISRITNLTAMFSCYDDGSGIQSIRAGVGTYPGGEDVHSFVDIRDLSLKMAADRKATWVTFTNINITKLTRYHVTIHVQDMVGYKRTLSSDGIIMDTTAPTVLPTYIRDGFQGVDRKYSKEFDVFPAHWENAFADAESGIGEYFVGLGSSPGLDDKSSFKSYKLSKKALISSDHLESGVTYYVTVIACNGVGMCVNGSSDGAMVDFIPPHTGLIIPGEDGPPLKTTWMNQAAWARWQWCLVDRSKLRASFNNCDALSFYDVHSGIRRFGLTVLSYDTVDILSPIKTVGRVVSSGRHVVMPNGVFSVLVQAEDHAGASSNAISKPFIVDNTVPRISKVYHGRENDEILYTRTKDYLFTAFFEILEDITEIISYSVGVSTFPGGDDVLPFTMYQLTRNSNIVSVNWTSAKVQTLNIGRKYYITVKSTNAANLFSISSSSPLIFDNEPPLVFHVFDGWGSPDSHYHPFTNIYRVHWQGISDISGVERIEACLSSTQDENQCNIHHKVNVSTKAMSHTFRNVSLQSGTHCYAFLGLQDKAGNYGSFWSTGEIIDTSPPINGQAKDGQGGTDSVYQRETNILYASWTGFLENQVHIHHYELAFGTTPNESNIQPFTNVGLVTSSSSSNLLVSKLSNGVTYYALVVAYNVLGMKSDIAVSDGVLVETTPPVFLSSVCDGTVFGLDFDYSSNATFLSINWKCEDKDSGLKQVFVGIGTQPGVQDIVSYRPALPYQIFYRFDGLNLTSGFRYFSTVKCINNVGLHSSMSSDGIIVDSTPPVFRFANIGRERYQNSPYFGLRSFLTANWNFNDFESNVVGYRVSIHHLKNNTQIAGPWAFPGNQTSESFNLSKSRFRHKERYALSVTAFNAAGLSTTGVSSFLVDRTAPVCRNIFDANLDGDKTRFSGLTSKLAVHAYCNDVETGILKHELAIRNLETYEYVVPFHNFKKNLDLAFLVIVGGLGKKVVELQHGNQYQVGLRITNNVNLTGEYWTPGVTVDATGPIFRRVSTSYNVHHDALQCAWQLFDNESGIKSLHWSFSTSPGIARAENFTRIPQNVTYLIISDTSLILGKTYYVYLKAINNAGSSTLFVSHGVLVDRTPPSAGNVWADYVLPENYDGNTNVTHGASFPVRWNGFIDNESGIKSYGWSIAMTQQETAALGDDIFKKIKFTGISNGYIIKNLTIHTDTIYYVSMYVYGL